MKAGKKYQNKKAGSKKLQKKFMSQIAAAGTTSH